MGKYKSLGNFFDRIFRNDLNANFDEVDADIKVQKARVDNLITGNPQPEEVMDLRTDTEGIIHGTAWDRFASDETKKATKFQEIDDQLAEKVSQGESGAITWAMAAQDFREQITGGNTAVVGEGAVLEVNIVDKAVSPQKTSFATVGKNKFDKSKRTLDLYLYHVNGVVTANANYDISDYIPVTNGQSYTINKARNYALYDANKTFLSGVDGTGSSMTLTPSQNGYLRFTLLKTDVDIVQVEEGNTATTYEPPGTAIKNLSVPDKFFTKNKLDDLVTYDAYPFQALANFSYNSAAEKEIRNAVKMIELFGADFSKKYCLGIIQRNFSTYGTGAYIYECDSTGATTKIIAMTSKTSYAAPTGIDVFTLAPYQNSGISAKLYVDWSKIPDNKQYVNTHYDKSGLDFRTYANDSVSNEVKIKLPPTIPALVGKEVNVYFDNIILADNLNDYQIEVSCDLGKQQNERWTATPSTAGTFPLSVSLYKAGSLIVSTTSNVVVKAATVGSGITKKAVFIGDSTTDAGSYTGELVNGLFASDVMNLQLLGTRGTAPNLHEGRAGWRASNYLNDASVSGVVNAFYNNGFDFTYYMNQQGYTNVDVVGIHLGINDTFSYTDDSSLLTETNNILNRFDTMLNSIKAFDSNIKVAFLVTIPPSKNQDSFGNNYGNGQSQWRYRRNNFLFVEKLIDKYKGREADGIYLVPINVNIDIENNMVTETVPVNSRNPKTVVRQSNGVHPASSGYYQMSDIIYYWLKSFEN